MKTSVAKKLRNRVLAAFMAIAVMLSCVVPSAITASAAVAPQFYNETYGTPKQTIEGEDYGVEFSEFNVKIPDPEHPGQYKELAEGDVVSKDTEFQLSLKWHFADTVKEDEVVKNGFPLVMHFDLSDNMKFLDLFKTESEFVDGEGGTVLQYFFDGTDLWVAVWDDNDQTQGFHGSANLKARLDAEKEDANDDGELSVEFFDKQIEITVDEFMPELSAEKTAGAVIYDNGKFYQQFTIKVTSPKDANNVKVKDTFSTGGYYTSSKLHDLKVGGNAAAVDGEGNIVIDSMKKGESVEVTYSLEIDPTKSGYDNGLNNVEVSSEDVAKPGTASITPNYSAPYVNKSGTVSEDRKTISWTITYEPKDLANIEDVDSSYFEIKDTPGSGIKFTDELIRGLVAAGATYDLATGTLTIPMSAMEKASWSSTPLYTLTYETEIEEEYQNKLFDTQVSNEAQVTYPKEEKLKDVPVVAKGETTIHGIDDSYVEKKLDKAENSKFFWNTTVHLPNTDISSLELTDTVTNYTGYQHQKIDKDTVKITYNKDGKDITFSLSDTAKVEKFALENNDSILRINFTETFLKELNEAKIRDLAVTYETIAVDGSGSEVEINDALILENSFTFKATVEEIDTPVQKSDTFTKSPKFGGSKKSFGSGTSDDSLKHMDPYKEGIFSQRWAITIDNSKDTKFFPKDGDIITIVDVLPRNCIITPDSWVISVGDDEWNMHWWSGKEDKDNVSIEQKTLPNGQVEVTIKITVTGDMYKNVLTHYDASGWSSPRTKWAITFHYGTEMTKEAASKLFDDSISNNQDNVELINKADIYYNDESAVGGLEATSYLKLNAQDELDKYTLLEDMTKANKDINDNGEQAHIFHDGKGNYIRYRLVINKDGLYLGGVKDDGTPKVDKLTAVDKLGTGLKFGGVESGYEGEPVIDGQTITFTLDNGKSYDIVYKAYIDRVNNETECTPEQAKEKFNNQVTLEGVSTLKLNKDSMISASVYKADYSGGATTQEATVEINGTKVWKNDNKDKRPNSITITVEKKDSKGDTVETTPYTYDSTKQDPANGFTVNGNEWSFKITGLVSKTEDGQVFTYNITEVEVDGYKTTYDGENIGIGNTSGKRIVDLTIINDGELTSLNVNKVWATNIEDYGLSAKSVTVHLTENGKKTEKSLELNEKNSWKGTFTDLPMYDSAGNKITYSAVEDNIDHFKSETKTTGNSVTITNNVDYESFKTSVSGTKTWVDESNKYGTRPASIKIYLYANGESAGDVTLNGTGDVWTYEFKDLPMYDKDGNKIDYTVSEGALVGSPYSAQQDGDYNFINRLNTAKVTIQKVDEEGNLLEGATLQLWDRFGKLYEWTTDAKNNPYEVHLVPGEMYTLKEIKAPDGYDLAEDMEFTAPTIGTATWTMTDKKTPEKPKASILKVDEAGKPLAGAKLEVLCDGKEVTSWTTDGKAKEIELEAGKEYILRELDAPKGYEKAADVKFTAPEAGKTVEVKMIDKKKSEEPKPTKVEISKKDITNGKELPGAKLKVVDKDGNVIKEWVSTDKPAYFENVFKAGETYTLIEETAPNGYVKAKEVEFTVNADGSITQVEMTDDVTKVRISKKDITNGEELAGAKLQVKDSSGKVIDEWTSGTTPHDINGKLVAGATYTLHEETAPNGYVVANDITFIVNKDGSVTQVEMTDDVTKVQISKKDITGGNELPGAHLIVVDENGDTVADFYSTDKPTYFEAIFEAGKTYTLREETAPDGYVVAEEVTFTVSTNGDIDVVEMVDDTTKVQISKQDLTNGKELAGAKLKVVDKDGNVIKEWTSTDKPAYFENVFKAGETYWLIEETAPNGYVIAEEVEFTVSEDGIIDKVVMKDDVTKASISKKDITGDGELAGAKLQVLDKNGKVIDEWVSGDKPHEINGVLVAGETYTLHEEVAPDGYVVANDIKFVVNADGTVTKVTMIDEAKSGTDLDDDSNDKDSGVAQGGGSNDKDNDSPKTGDSNNITLVMLALALGVMALTSKKRRNN